MKYRYSINNNNQLIIKHANKRRPLIANGEFSIDKYNQLIYWLNEPSLWKRQYNLPHKVSFKGNWNLNPNYDLELILNKTKEQFLGDRLVLKGEIISTDTDALSFEIKSLDRLGLSHIQLLKLNGFWGVDAYNRLGFIIKKKTQDDIITLEGIWQINKNQQIIYNYEKTDLKTKSKILHTFSFEGFWQMNNSNRLTYILKRSLNSRFDFRVQIESPNLYPKDGLIKYRLGIGLRKDNSSQIKIISLFGNWKFNRKLGLIFQMDYGKDKIQVMEFGTNIHLNKKDEIIFSLTNKRQEPLGINITFRHRFLKKNFAETFLRLKKLERESAIETGVRIPF